MAGKAGQEILAKLVRQADVLIDNFKLGTLAKWGFDDAWFEREAPRLVRCSITGYGPTGPKAALPGYDFILQAESGLMSICGAPDGVPTKYGVAIVDVCTGMLACNAILAAINARHIPAAARKSTCRFTRHRWSCWATSPQTYLLAGRGGGAFRQWPSEHRAVHDLSCRRCNDCGRGRQRGAVRAVRRAARPPRMGEGRALRVEPRPRRQPRRPSTA